LLTHAAVRRSFSLTKFRMYDARCCGSIRIKSTFPWPDADAPPWPPDDRRALVRYSTMLRRRGLSQSAISDRKNARRARYVVERNHSHRPLTSPSSTSVAAMTNGEVRPDEEDRLVLLIVL
jgi:hypothetical protein